jgi:hypothetical protein
MLYMIAIGIVSDLPVYHRSISTSAGYIEMPPETPVWIAVPAYNWMWN